MQENIQVYQKSNKVQCLPTSSAVHLLLSFSFRVNEDQEKEDFVTRKCFSSQIDREPFGLVEDLGSERDAKGRFDRLSARRERLECLSTQHTKGQRDLPAIRRLQNGRRCTPLCPPTTSNMYPCMR